MCLFPEDRALLDAVLSRDPARLGEVARAPRCSMAGPKAIMALMLATVHLRLPRVSLLRYAVSSELEWSIPMPVESDGDFHVGFAALLWEQQAGFGVDPVASTLL